MDEDQKYTNSSGRRYLPWDADFHLAKDMRADFRSNLTHFRILSMERADDKTSVKESAEQAVGWMEAWGEQLVGVDLVGVEDDGHSLLYHAHTLLSLDVPLYLGAGVTLWPPDIDPSDGGEDMGGPGGNVYDAVVLETRRVGGGLSLASHPQLLRVLSDRGTAVEVCPARDQLLGYVPDMRAHPAVGYFRSGVPIVLASCDAGTMGTDLTVDWYLAYVGWGLGLADIKQLAINSLNYSAMATDDVTSAIDKVWTPAWDRYIRTLYDDACKADLTTSVPDLHHVMPTSVSLKSPSGVHVYGKHFERGICNDIVCRFGDVKTNNTRYVTSRHLICATPVSMETLDEEVAVQVSFDGGQSYVDRGLKVTFTKSGGSRGSITTGRGITLGLLMVALLI